MRLLDLFKKKKKLTFEKTEIEFISEYFKYLDESRVSSISKYLVEPLLSDPIKDRYNSYKIPKSFLDCGYRMIVPSNLKEGSITYPTGRRKINHPLYVEVFFCQFNNKGYDRLNNKNYFQIIKPDYADNFGVLTGENKLYKTKTLEEACRKIEELSLISKLSSLLNISGIFKNPFPENWHEDILSMVEDYSLIRNGKLSEFRFRELCSELELENTVSIDALIHAAKRYKLEFIE